MQIVAIKSGFDSWWYTAVLTLLHSTISSSESWWIYFKSQTRHESKCRNRETSILHSQMKKTNQIISMQTILHARLLQRAKCMGTESNQIQINAMPDIEVIRFQFNCISSHEAPFVLRTNDDDLVPNRP